MSAICFRVTCILMLSPSKINIWLSCNNHTLNIQDKITIVKYFLYNSYDYFYMLCIIVAIIMPTNKPLLYIDFSYLLEFCPQPTWQNRVIMILYGQLSTDLLTGCTLLWIETRKLYNRWTKLDILEIFVYCLCYIPYNILYFALFTYSLKRKW